MLSGGSSVESVNQVRKDFGVVVGAGMSEVLIQLGFQVFDEAFGNGCLGFRGGLELEDKILLPIL